jgi:hypothetical protein
VAKRIDEYEVSSLHTEDHLEANLGSINAALMRISVSMQEAMERTISPGAMTTERLQKLVPIIETLLRVTRQIDRFAQLERRLAQSQRIKDPWNIPGFGEMGSPASEDLRF